MVTLLFISTQEGNQSKLIINWQRVISVLIMLILLGKVSGQTNPDRHKLENGKDESIYSYIPKEQLSVELGIKTGIGSISLLGFDTAEVNSYQMFHFCYKAGKTGMKAGGGIRIGLRHQLPWSAFQTEDPVAEGYTTSNLETGKPLSVMIPQTGVFNEFFMPYFPWQNMLEVIVPEPGLNPGELLFITLGDTTKGSKGIRIQPVDEFPFVFKCYVDISGTGNYLPLKDNPSIQIVASEPYKLSVVMPSDVVIGKPARALVRVEDIYGNPIANYREKVKISSSELGGMDLIQYTFKSKDKGVSFFENIVFKETGVFMVSATDGKLSGQSNPVRVHKSEPTTKTFWGDIHGHTLFSDGRGTIEQYYDFARNVAGLDFCAVTDHGFQLTDEMWEYSKRVTNIANDPGQFVTIQAFEWSGMTEVGGDHNIYFIDENPRTYRSRSYYNYQNYQMYHGLIPQINHIEDLFKALKKDYKKGEVLCIPHFGGRPASNEWHDPDLQRAIEVFSEHRRSHEWMQKFLSEGYRLGIMASSDSHLGHPGYGYLKVRQPVDWKKKEIGMALIGVQAEELTRESIFRAIYNRHIYATSGERIILEFRVNGNPMGSEIYVENQPQISILVKGTKTIQKVEIIKNNEIIQTFSPGKINSKIDWTDNTYNHQESCYYFIRIEQIDGEEAISSPVWVN